MPLLAWVTVQVLQPAPELAAGLLIVGCVPGAMASNVLTLAARGNVSYSVSLTTSATLLSPLIVPVALWLTVDQSINYNHWVPFRLMLLRVVLPVVVGHLLSRFLKRFRQLAERAGSTVANTAILGIIAIAVALNRSGVMQASLVLMGALAAINAGGYLTGYFGAAAFRLPEPIEAGSDAGNRNAECGGRRGSGHHTVRRKISCRRSLHSVYLWLHADRHNSGNRLAMADRQKHDRNSHHHEHNMSTARDSKQ